MSDHKLHTTQIETEVLTEAFFSPLGIIKDHFPCQACVGQAITAVAAKVRELDAPGHATETERAYIRGWRDRDAGAAWSPQPPQPPKSKTADHFSPEAHAIYDALNAAGHLTGLATCEIAAQAAHEFLSKPKVTAGELLNKAMTSCNALPFDDGRAEEFAQAFLTLAREHGQVEGQP